MNKQTSWIIVASLVGIITDILGFPIMVNGALSFKCLILMASLNVCFYVVLNSKDS